MTDQAQPVAERQDGPLRKLHFYAGNCVHYSPKPGGIYECDKGIDIRAHVGGPDFGWMARMPCCNTKLSRDRVSCDLREMPTPERVAADQSTAEQQMRAVLNGACPECGKVLRLRENDDVQIQECLDGHVAMRGCKRIGEHL